MDSPTETYRAFVSKVDCPIEVPFDVFLQPNTLYKQQLLEKCKNCPQNEGQEEIHVQGVAF